MPYTRIRIQSLQHFVICRIVDHCESTVLNLILLFIHKFILFAIAQPERLPFDFRIVKILDFFFRLKVIVSLHFDRLDVVQAIERFIYVVQLPFCVGLDCVQCDRNCIRNEHVNDRNKQTRTNENHNRNISYISNAQWIRLTCATQAARLPDEWWLAWQLVMRAVMSIYFEKYNKSDDGDDDWYLWRKPIRCNATHMWHVMTRINCLLNWT